MKIKELLEYGKNNLIEKEEPYKLSKMLLKSILHIDTTYLLINSEKEITKEIENKYKKGIHDLKSGKPLQYITNKQEFMGLDFYVDENVLIPQPDTEILVEEVLNKIEKLKGKINVLDICTGSGAIGVSIAKNATNVNVTMSDISKNALKVAQKNAKTNEVLDKCKFIKSNMFENIEEKYDVIVSNPPYIKSKIIKTLEKEVQNEPLIALDGGEDGLDFYKIIIQTSYKHLKENGILALEIGYDQKEEVIKLIEESNKYINIYCKKDLAGNDRIIICNL